MKLDLNEIFSGDVESIDINYTLDLSDVLESGQAIFKKPIPIIGRVENHAGVVTCSYGADVCLSAICDRCLEPFELCEKKNFSSILLRSANDQQNTEHYICDNGYLDFTDMARTDILLNIPPKLLCNEDCLGLCDQCGAKLEEQECSCMSNQIDPRLAKLQQLLEQ